MTSLQAWADTAAAVAARDPGCAALHLADGVLAWRAGRATPEGKQLGAWYAHADPSPLGEAARIAASMRHTEMDDIHRSSGITPTAIALPALLPWMQGHDGRAVLDAYVAGIEVAVRAGQAMGGVTLFERGQWPSLMVAPIGAAAALGRLLGLDRRAMERALAMAVLQCVRAPGKTVGEHPARWLMFGQAVRTGCLAAIAASQGVDADVDAAASVLGAMPACAAGVQAIEQTSFKPHAAAKQALAAIDAVARLEQAWPGGPPRIARIDVHLPKAYVNMLQREGPAGGRLARLVHGPWQLALQSVAPQALFDTARGDLPPALSARVEALAAKVHLAHDPALDGCYPGQWPARVVMEAEGVVRELTVLDSPGDPGTGVDAAWVADKAARVLSRRADRDLVGICLRQDGTARWVEMLSLARGVAAPV